MRTTPDNFRRRVLEIEDQEITFKFIQDALRWAKGEGDETLENTFREYADPAACAGPCGRSIRFGESFDPEALNAFLHLTAPPPSLDKVEADRPERSEKDRNREGLESLHDPTEKRTIQTRAGEQTFGEMAFMPVPAGKFLMGSREDDEMAYDNEYPQHTVEIPYEYYIGRFPVTNADYTKYSKAASNDFSIPDGKADHPVVDVSWNDLQDYCRWLNQTYPGELPEGYALPAGNRGRVGKGCPGRIRQPVALGERLGPQTM